MGQQEFTNDTAKQREGLVVPGVIRRAATPESAGWLSRRGQGREIQQQLQSPSGGRLLDGPVREQMEAGFGQPLPNRRLHTDDGADRATQALGARALAVGNDVYFARGEYQPDSPDGTHLLAHELAHTLQPSGGPQAQLVVGRADDPAEREAESAAVTVTERLAVSAADGSMDRAPAAPQLRASSTLGAIRCMGRAPEPAGFDYGDVRFVPPDFLGERSLRTFRTIQRRIESGRLLGPAILGAAVILAATSSPEEYASPAAEPG